MIKYLKEIDKEQQLYDYPVEGSYPIEVEVDTNIDTEAIKKEYQAKEKLKALTTTERLERLEKMLGIIK